MENSMEVEIDLDCPACGLPNAFKAVMFEDSNAGVPSTSGVSTCHRCNSRFLVSMKEEEL